MTNIRVLTTAGIEKFEKWLKEYKRGEVDNFPREEFLRESISANLLDKAKNLQSKSFSNQWEMGKYLYECLESCNFDVIENNKGLWTWITIYYFNEICPIRKNNRRNILEIARYIPTSDYQRHIIRSAVMLYKQHRKFAKCLLISSKSKKGELKYGDFLEQLAKQEITTNNALIELAYQLYFDEKVQKPKKGASPNWEKPGTLRRFKKIVSQLSLTFDLHVMTANEIKKLLPVEFNPWVNTA